jgi:hypothetical protein
LRWIRKLQPVRTFQAEDMTVHSKKSDSGGSYFHHLPACCDYSPIFEFLTAFESIASQTMLHIEWRSSIDNSPTILKGNPHTI